MAAHLPGTVSGRASRQTPTTDREPLCTIAMLPLPSCAPGTGQPELPGLHSSYWLMRQTIILLPTSVSLLRQILAGCCEPLLEDGPSRRYLCDPCIGAWVPTPPRLSGAFVRFFPDHIGLILTLRNSARENILQAASRRGFYLEAATIRLSSGSHTCSTLRLL